MRGSLEIGNCQLLMHFLCLDKHKVEIRRKSTQPGGKDRVFTVDVGLIQDKGKTDTDLPLEAGDVIYVPERVIRL